MEQEIADFLTNIGIRSAAIHRSFDHFDFSRGSRIILVIGPMGSGKTEFVTRVWRDAQVAQKKSKLARARTVTADGADRRNIFVVKNKLDAIRFADNPSHALSFRGGYIECGEHIGEIADSFELETLIDIHPRCGTWIIDEAGFYDERIAFIMKKYAAKRELVFICPTLSLNFRNNIFNTTIALLVEYASDVFPLTAYCEHVDCLRNAVYSYRYYSTDRGGRRELPALYFDPLIMIGGDQDRRDDYCPNYEARCSRHHFLPGKEYAHITLRPHAMRASHSDSAPLLRELAAINGDMEHSELYRDFMERYGDNPTEKDGALRSLMVKSIAERALVYLYAEANLIDGQLARRIVQKLSLNTRYVERISAENGKRLML